MTTTTNTAAALLNARRNKSALEAQMIALTEAQETATLLAAHGDLTARTHRDDAESLTMATIADVLTARHNLDEALDEILFDLDFEGTYHDALIIAIAMVA